MVLKPTSTFDLFSFELLLIYFVVADVYSAAIVKESLEDLQVLSRDKASTLFVRGTVKIIQTY